MFIAALIYLVSSPPTEFSTIFIAINFFTDDIDTLFLDETSSSKGWLRSELSATAGHRNSELQLFMHGLTTHKHL